MRGRDATKRLCCGALLMAAGVLLPQVFHLAGGPAMGGVFLPMHFPVLLAGLLLGPEYGMAVGLLAPAMSFLLTGMPPAAKLPFMLIELVAYGLFSGLFARLFRSRLAALVLAQLCGRLANAAGLWLALRVIHLNAPPAATVVTALMAGLPGIALQLLLLPGLVKILQRGLRLESDSRTSGQTAA